MLELFSFDKLFIMLLLVQISENATEKEQTHQITMH